MLNSEKFIEAQRRAISKIAKRSHSERSKYHRNGPVTVYGPGSAKVQAINTDGRDEVVAVNPQLAADQVQEVAA